MSYSHSEKVRITTAKKHTSEKESDCIGSL
uniref:Uncharacterized protein n=1 Tax=Anguilla anguilla TaxID=7936 RepID=A0A0E9PP13_ANGAN